mmetsp:Transcript_46977/g.71828  ORF Transcript_46977/g.71828 Transcript_46977/m.71828 type:complete len:613 (-) Transcript_46977:21-1859(-)
MSASSLVATLVGFSDEDDDYEDYFDEDCEDLYSPYAEPPPIAPPVEEEVKLEEIVPRPKKHKKRITCEVCQIEIPEDSLRAHEGSKKHKGVVMNKKILLNQQKAEEEMRKRINKGTEIFDQVFSENVIEAVIGHIPGDQLLKFRLVCRKWKNYIENPDNWRRQYFLHKGIEIESLRACYESGDFALLRLGHNILVEGTASVEQFLTRTHYNISNIKFCMTQLKEVPDDLWQKLCDKFSSIEPEILYLQFSVNSSSEGYSATEFTKKFTSALFSNLAQNRNVDTLECVISPSLKVKKNPLAFLESNKHLRVIKLSSEWFSYIRKNDEFDAVEREALENAQQFSFQNTSVSSLEIKFDGSSQQFGDIRGFYLLQSLQNNTVLSDLSLHFLRLNGKKKFRQELEKLLVSDMPLKKLDLSNNSLGKVDWAILSRNTSLEFLDLSQTQLASLATYKGWHKNDSLLNLNLRGSQQRLTQQGLQNLPCGLTTLNLSRIVTNANARDAIGDGVFAGLEVHLPMLTTLDISGNIFTDFRCLSKYLAKTTTLRTLFVFAGSQVKYGSFDDLIYSGFRKNNTLTKSDHLAENVTFEGEGIAQEITNCLRGNTRNLGRLTKGIR